MTVNIKDRKLVQLLAYLANKNSSGQINKLKVIKLVWAADRFHLRKYGRLVSGDDYFALKYGPVASQLKNIAEHDNYLPEAYIQYAKEFISPIKNKTEIQAKREADTDLLSKSDKEALDFAWDQFGNKTGFNLADFSHLYPEWSKFKQLIESGEVSRERINLVDFFDAPSEMSEDPFALDQELLDHTKEIFLQNQIIENALTI